MKINLYIDVTDSDGFVYFRGVTTDSVESTQKSISSKYITGPCRTYRVIFDIPDLAKVHRIALTQDAVEEVKE